MGGEGCEKFGVGAGMRIDAGYWSVSRGRSIPASLLAPKGTFQQMCLREAAANELNSERQAVRRQSDRKGNRRQARVAPRGVEGGVPGGR